VPTVIVVLMAGSVMTGQTLMLTSWSLKQPFASVARTVTLTAAPVEAVGVPLSTPPLLNVRPAGQMPLGVVQA
jgi:hypothetical protein